MTFLIRIAKKIKALLKITKATEAYLYPVRRIDRLAIKERIVAMTFDDGPCALPAVPDAFGGAALTDVILDILKKYDAKATFDVIGDTGENYPDNAGREGSAQWGGISYDHYPDINKDAFGGAVSQGELIKRISDEEHEIANHGFRHMIFGAQPLVYGKRKSHADAKAVLADLSRLHGFMKDKFGVEIKLSRPPHYVDKIDDALTSFDVYALAGYQYMGASFDGAGWLPRKELEQEIQDMSAPLEAILSADADALCGQIIFQKDGFNMSRRTPVAYGLEKQLQTLKKYGYKVVTVSELLSHSCCSDVFPDDEIYPALDYLTAAGRAVLFSDNRLHADKPITRGEFAAMAAPPECFLRRAENLIKGQRGNFCADVFNKDKYSAAIAYCVENNAMFLKGGLFKPKESITAEDAAHALKTLYGINAAFDAPPTRRQVISMLYDALK